jgi:hypothetical protein
LTMFTSHLIISNPQLISFLLLSTHHPWVGQLVRNPRSRVIVLKHIDMS